VEVHGLEVGQFLRSSVFLDLLYFFLTKASLKTAKNSAKFKLTMVIITLF